jgi:hypothetical protein
MRRSRALSSSPRRLTLKAISGALRRRSSAGRGSSCRGPKSGSSSPASIPLGFRPRAVERRSARGRVVTRPAARSSPTRSPGQREVAGSSRSSGRIGTIGRRRRRRSAGKRPRGARVIRLRDLDSGEHPSSGWRSEPTTVNTDRCDRRRRGARGAHAPRARPRSRRSSPDPGLPRSSGPIRAASSFEL